MSFSMTETELQERYSKYNKVKGQAQEKQPGEQGEMSPEPDCGEETYRGSGKLQDQVVIITGGDSGIGRAVAIAFAREGADVAIVYLDEHEDAQKTASYVEKEGRKCLLLSGDVGDESFCKKAVKETVEKLGKLNHLVNNAAEQHLVEPDELTDGHIERTFRTNIFSYMYFVSAAMPHLSKGSTIINTTSITAYKGSEKLLIYSSTKGAIVTFTRSLSQALVDKGIRVNAVAPGPVWTPLIPASFPEDQVENFGQDYPLGRAAQPAEMAPSYVFLASADSTCMTGQVLHPNCGVVVGG